MIAGLCQEFKTQFFFQWPVNFRHQGQHVGVKEPANLCNQNVLSVGVQQYFKPHGWVSLTKQQCA